MIPLTAAEQGFVLPAFLTAPDKRRRRWDARWDADEEQGGRSAVAMVPAAAGAAASAGVMPPAIHEAAAGRSGLCSLSGDRTWMEGNHLERRVG